MARKPVKPAELKLRIPRGLHQMIEAEARRNERSLNQEAILRLQRSFSDDQMRDVAKFAALETALSINKTIDLRFANLTDRLNMLFVKLGYPEFALQTTEENNG
ncbi:Arc family DNA-binding protein [Bradyrhizobium sp. SZCCHNR1093]|uniref:Arc family DNA-binding protein n=1 Tax=Bradyrhizobium sp. SZCCHNR1093 TaxID=3057368 RepID=UPI0028E424E9|nr:Arc family DNA-binding protein [Bradyrhizobium sp. SZCCHNR1093]